MKHQLGQLLRLVKTFSTIQNYKFYKYNFINSCSGDAVVLVNGPSMNNTLKDYSDGKITIDNNCFVVNQFALSDYFLKIKPKYYCLDDPIFYRDYEPKKEAIRKMYDIIDQNVDWNMTIFMCFPTDIENDMLIKYSGIKNPHVHFVRMNRKLCADIDESLRNRLYSTGYFMPQAGTVANTAIYLAILMGYKTIRLYGADHSMLKDLAVNDKNELCSLDTHFYDKGEPKMTPFLNTCLEEAKPWKISEFVYVVSEMFHSHDLLRSFADYKGCRIINCTPNSMIDSYERLKQ